MPKDNSGESSTDCREDEGIATLMVDSIIGAARVLKRNYSDYLDTEALKDLGDDEDVAWILEKSREANTMENKKEAQSVTVQPTYVDESGKVFTSTDIVQGYRPKGKWKGHSISGDVNSPNWGKVTNFGK